MLLGRIGVTPNYRPLSFRSAYQAGAFLEMFYKILHLPGEPALTKYTAATLGTSQTLNIDKARGMLGYRPIYSLREGIETYAEWWKDNH
jgi:nucleoside-diphosphate-sugar epimerase